MEVVTANQFYAHDRLGILEVEASLKARLTQSLKAGGTDEGWRHR